MPVQTFYPASLEYYDPEAEPDVEEIEHHGRVLGTPVEVNGWDMYLVAKGTELYKGYPKRECVDVDDKAVRACWFGDEETAVHYSKGAVHRVVKFVVLKDLLLFDILSAKNINAMLDYADSKGLDTGDIIVATGIGQDHSVVDEVLHFFMKPEVMQSGGSVRDSDGDMDESPRSSDGSEIELPPYAIPSVVLQGGRTHEVGNGPEYIFRTSQFAVDAEVLRSIQEMFSAIDLEVHGYHGGETYGGSGKFPAEVALFQYKDCVEKVCPVSGGGGAGDMDSELPNMFREDVDLTSPRKGGGGHRHFTAAQIALLALTLVASVIA